MASQISISNEKLLRLVTVESLLDQFHAQRGRFMRETELRFEDIKPHNSLRDLKVYATKCYSSLQKQIKAARTRQDFAALLEAFLERTRMSANEFLNASTDKDRGILLNHAQVMKTVFAERQRRAEAAKPSTPDAVAIAKATAEFHAFVKSKAETLGSLRDRWQEEKGIEPFGDYIKVVKSALPKELVFKAMTQSFAIDLTHATQPLRFRIKINARNIKCTVTKQ